jgi:hypothetical protein
MLKGILIHLRPLTLLIVVLAIALGLAPIALAAQAYEPAAPSDPPAPPKVTPARDGGTSNAASFSASTITNVYLPSVLKDYPPLPAMPALNTIANADGDGNYTVSWNASARATSYLLQEDDNAAFSSPETRYSGSDTSWNATGMANGSYYYRVQASNTWGASAWSNVESADVGPTPGYWFVHDPIGDVEFYVTSDRGYVENFAVYVAQCGNYKIANAAQVPISGNSFSFTGSFYASGTFSSPTSASGTLGVTEYNIPGVCGTQTAGPLPWSANWMHILQLMPEGAAGTIWVAPTEARNAFEVTRIP